MPTIVIYTQAKCHPCDATKRRAEKKGLPYTDVDLDSEVGLRDTLSSEGFRATPIVKVYADDGSEIDKWSGFQPTKIDKYAKELRNEN